MTAPLAYRHHNHQQCIHSALAKAKQLCQDRGVKLTRLREQVLTIVWESHRPLGAYKIMEILAGADTRSVAPPTVYRALDFLAGQELIHKIHSLNAFVGCALPDESHQSHFLICQSCQVAVEYCQSRALTDAVSHAADETGFLVEQQSLEVLGLCPQCQEPDNTGKHNNSEH